MKKILVITAAIVLVLLLTACNQTSDTPATINSSPVSTTSSAPAVTITSNSDGIEIATLLTAHFDISSYDSDSTYLIELGNTLEDSYLRITTDLRTELSEKLPIYIYSDPASFHVAIGRPDASDYTVGTAGDGTIKMVSPINSRTHSYEEMLKVAVHEFAHIVVSQINPDYISIPIWLNEGVATYEAHQEPKQLGVSKYPTLKYPTLDELSAYDQSFSDLDGYSYSYTLVSFLVDEYGWEKIRALIDSYSDIEAILGVPENEFHALWTIYADQNFKQH